MLKLAVHQLRTQFRRTFAVVVAVVLGVAFFSASMMSGTVITNAIRGEVGNQLRGADLLVVSEYGNIDPELEANLANIPGVAETDSVPGAFGQTSAGGGATVLRFGVVPSLSDLVTQMPVAQGRLPKAGDEVALTEGAAATLGVEIDDLILWESFDANQQGPIQLRVVGLISGGNAFGTNLTAAFLTPDVFYRNVSDPAIYGIVVQVADQASVSTVQDQLRGVVPDDLSVLTFDQMVDAEVASLEQGSNALTYGLGAFALISLFVAGIVISNTFSITLVQRTHELAMLRCIGAEKRQIHRTVIIEAVMLGVLSSVVGLVLGYGIVDTGARILVKGSGGLGLANVSALVLIAPILTGTMVTVISAIVPARNATAIHPLQALRHTDAPVERTAAGGMIRLVLSGLLIVGGAMLLLGGMVLSLGMKDEAPVGPLLIGMLGGALSFIGLLIASAFVIPLGVKLFGGLIAAVRGVPAQIASSNAMRNPRRTAATSSALMMGVALIAMMTVGAATVQATWNDVVDQQTPIDLSIQQSMESPGASLSPAIFEGFSHVDGLKSIVPIHALTTQMSYGGQETEISTVAVDPDDAREISRSADVFREFRDGMVVIPQDIAESRGMADGDFVTFSHNGRSIELRVRIVKMFDYEVYVTPGDASRLTSQLPITGAWLRLSDDASVKDVVKELTDGIPDGESVAIHGGASDRATYLGLVDQVLLVTTGLLGVAVIIAIVGVGNTLTLSVLERTRESGMLRAMGLTAQQLRESLAIEGMLIAGTGGIIGLGAGAIYGWIGAITLFGPSWSVVPGFPIVRLALILLVAILAGVIASVLPGRRAASISPVEALATV